MKMLVALAVTVFLAACAHTVNMQDFEHAGSKVGELKGKAVGIVIDPALIHDNTETSRSGHSVKVENATVGLTKALTDRLNGNAKSILIMSPEQSKTHANVDVILYPEFDARVVDDFWVLHCLVKYRMTVRNRDGKQLGVGEAQAKRRISDDDSCKTALTTIFNKVNDDAFSDL